MEDPTYDDFWLSYLKAHSKRLTRQLHFIGITIILVGIIAALYEMDWRIAAASITAGYFLAWLGHFTVQGNEPLAFQGVKMAFWSLISAMRMYCLGMCFQLRPELRRAGIEQAS